MTRALVLGAGYAGVVAANKLARRGFDVTIVNPVPHFVERVRLHRVAANHRPHARIPMDRVLHHEIKTITSTADRIDADDNLVVLASGEEIDFDWLIVTVGSGHRRDHRQRHSVANEHAAARLSDTLARRPYAPVRVLGAGLTGVETAAALATAGRDVTLASRTAWPEDAYHRAQQRRLDRLGIPLVFSERDAPNPPDELLVDCTGLQTPPLAASSGLPTDDRGRLVVTPTLQVANHPRIIGAGDAICVAGPDASHLRMSCATALPMGAHAADVITAVEGLRTPPPFQHDYIIRCIDLGRFTGRVQLVTGRDRLRRFALASWLGGLGKELVIRGTITTMRAARGVLHRGRDRRRENP
ncbi:FAD-dependent oxidoreductase [Leucobacter sp. gxy201]|uniref:NAD(P)/FAD-dependent oxidoreductase n=1 Tax=Leucobacter sp. gxy201 TaxID=2957200 RepID=UPI003DA0B6CA